MAAVNLSTSTNDHGTGCGEENGVDFLTHHMVGVLRYQGFDHVACSTVVDRVERNTITTDINASAAASLNREPVQQAVDTGLLDKETLAARGLQVNSNEPVVLLETASDKIVGSESESVRLALAAHNIFPVRLYIRKSANQSSEKMAVSLLNVVNTDIGGPSMVQLLDTAFHDISWKQKLLVKEAYNRYGLLWRDAAGPSESAIVEDVPTSIAKDSNISSQDLHEMLEKPSSPLGSADGAIPDIQEDIIVPSEPAQHRNIDDPTSDDYEDVPDPVEHPAMKELREKEAIRPSVSHPTWSRDHDKDGLLDIITTHSEQSVIRGGVSSTDDDFEMIETT